MKYKSIERKENCRRLKGCWTWKAKERIEQIIKDFGLMSISIKSTYDNGLFIYLFNLDESVTFYIINNIDTTHFSCALNILDIIQESTPFYISSMLKNIFPILEGNILKWYCIVLTFGSIDCSKVWWLPYLSILTLLW